MEVVPPKATMFLLMLAYVIQLARKHSLSVTSSLLPVLPDQRHKHSLPNRTTSPSDRASHILSDEPSTTRKYCRIHIARSTCSIQFLSLRSLGKFCCVVPMPVPTFSIHACRWGMTLDRWRQLQSCACMEQFSQPRSALA